MQIKWIIEMRKIKLTQDLTYVPLEENGEGEIETIKEYPTGALAGSVARLITFTYDVDDRLVKRETTKTTV